MSRTPRVMSRTPQIPSVSPDLERLRTWSRHNNYKTPKSMQDVWSTSYQRTFDGKKIGYDPDRYIIDYFNGNQRLVMTQKTHDSDRLRTTLNNRARGGFRYWLIERPRPTYFGRYGTGSFKSVLGLGNAPRT